MYTYLENSSNSSEDEDSPWCSCRRGYILYESGMCGHCTYNWINDNAISQNLEEAGYDHGQDVALEQAIRDTIYRRARDDYYNFDCDDAPDYANIDRESYGNGFEEGYGRRYNEIYNRHEPMLDELRRLHAKQLMKVRLLIRFARSPHLDFNLFETIEKYIPANFINNNF